MSFFLNVLWGVCSVREKQETTITLQSHIVAHIVPLTEAQFYSNRCFLKPTRMTGSSKHPNIRFSFSDF